MGSGASAGVSAAVAAASTEELQGLMAVLPADVKTKIGVSLTDATPLSRRTVAILHGALDPITDSIINLSGEILCQRHAQEVWLVPAQSAPSEVPKRQRLAMCHLAIEAKSSSTTPIYVVDADGDETSGEIVAVLRSLQSLHSTIDFLLVCGIEQMPNMRSWQEGEWLWNEAKWLLVPRSIISKPTDIPPKAVLLNSTVENSPAELRLRLQADPNFGADGLMPLPVASFIRRYGLYGVPLSPARSPGRRIAIMGGSFSPPTAGHTQMAADLLHSGRTDEVLMVPCGPRPDKPSLNVPAFHRYMMCELAVNNTASANFPVRVEPIEVLLPRALSSSELGNKLRERDPSHTYQMVFGADLYEESKAWDDGKFWEDNEFLWVPRAEFPLPADGPEKGKLVTPPKAVLEQRLASGAPDVNLLPCTSLETSSLIIRDQYKDGNLLAAEIGAGSRSVFSYWQRYNLYPSK